MMKLPHTDPEASTGPLLWLSVLTGFGTLRHSLPPIALRSSTGVLSSTLTLIRATLESRAESKGGGRTGKKTSVRGSLPRLVVLARIFHGPASAIP